MDKKGSGFKPKYILIILVAICLLLLVLSSVSSTINNAVRGTLNTILMPMQTGLNKVGGAISGKIEETSRLKEVEQENRTLRDEIDHLRSENSRYQLELSELDECRELLNMKKEYPDYNTIGAHVIGENSTNWNQSVLIDRGSSDGIKVNMNVIAQGGLVGIVTSVTSNSATVRTIIDHDNQIGAMSVLSQDSCIVRGDLSLYKDGKIIIEKINKNSDIYDDYKIVTSNKSSVYLPGIVIGYAKDIAVDSNSLTKSGYLTPIVDFTHLDNVLVITDLKENGQEQ